MAPCSFRPLAYLLFLATVFLETCARDENDDYDYSSSSSAAALIHRQTQEESLCPLDGSESEFEMKDAVILVDVTGRPGEFDLVQEEALLSLVEPFCESPADFSTYYWTNATFLDLVLEGVSSGELFANTTRNFTISIQVTVLSNLPKNNETDGLVDSILFREDGGENETDCDCALPTSEDMLLRLQIVVDERSLLPSLDAVLNVREAVPVDCPSSAPQPLGTMLAIDVENSFRDDADNNATFELLGQYALYTFNVLSGERCDGLFRQLDTATLLVANRTEDLRIPGLPPQPQERRFLQEEASAAPSLAPTDSPSASPSSRGPDLFTLVFELKGACNGCESDQKMFDQRSRRLTQDQARAATSAQQAGSTSYKSSKTQLQRELGVTTTAQDGSLQCFCPSPAVTEPLTDIVYLERLQREISSDERLDLVLLKAREVTRLDCPASAQGTFVSVVSASFIGNSEVFAPGSDSLPAVERILVGSYNQAADQTCDPQTRILSRSRVVEVVTASSERRNLQDLNTTNTTNTTLAPTEAPSQAPSRFGADLFELIFAIKGACNGCPADSSPFDQTNPRRNLDWLQVDGGGDYHHHHHPRWLQSSAQGQCFCGVGASQRAPNTMEYVESLRLALAAAGVEGIDQVLEAKELPEYVVDFDPFAEATEAPSASPSVSVSPSESPSVPLSAAPSVRPTPACLENIDDLGFGIGNLVYSGLVERNCGEEKLITQSCPSTDGADVIVRTFEGDGKCYRIKLQCCWDGTITVKKGCGQECVGSSVGLDSRDVFDTAVCDTCEGFQVIIDNQGVPTTACSTRGGTTSAKSVVIDFQTERGVTYYVYIDEGEVDQKCFPAPPPS